MPATPEHPDASAEIQARKAEHLDVTLTRDVDSQTPPGWNDIHLLHQALPEVDYADIDLSAVFLGRRLALPLLIAGMTGGHARAEQINALLAQAAERFGLAMGIGSQRAALRAPELARTYRVVREQAPTALLIANIGAPQLIPQDGSAPLTLEQARELVEMIRADALAVHLNFTEEIIQTEGDRRAKGCLAAIARLADELPVPIIVKETGAGLSRAVAEALKAAGVVGLDVGGVGGTSFAAVEAYRAGLRGDRRGERLGQLFRDWGIPTAVSIVQARQAGLPVIATGGIRSGLDAAKAINLGADLVGVARPLLACALEGAASVSAWIEQFAEELRAAAFLTGSASLADLRQRPRVVLGATQAWLTQLGA